MWWPLVSLLLQDPSAPVPRVTQSVVVTAATQPVPLDSLARAVTVLTREEIARMPSWSVADVLRLAGSVQVRSRGAFGVQTDISVRGGGFGQVLVLVDGVRINDSQSGHHNADIPVSVDRVERIEILRGTGSSLYGADAVVGAINVITRRGSAAPSAMVSVGEYGLARGSASAVLDHAGVQYALDGWGTRSAGFMFDREVATGGGSVAVRFSEQRGIGFSHLRNAFGANGFYGASPSKEWTDQTLLAYHDRAAVAGHRIDLHAAYRTHGDHFRWDVNRPGFAENQHRSHAVLAGGTARLGSDRTWTSVGAEAGGDWIRSNNLGDRRFGRGGVFVEHQRPLGGRATLYPALRYDHYSSFGGSWSPSVAAVVSLAPALRARGSAGRAFRVPTFTERYYRDPAHAARAELAPERAWGLEGGLDWTVAGWSLGATPFLRRESDVIDWVRATPQAMWQTDNIRAVRTHGVEATMLRPWRHGFVRVEYTWTRSSAPALTLLSKYVADYAPHSVAMSGAVRLPSAVWLGGRADCKEKSDGRSYCGVDVKGSRAFGRYELFVEVTNLFDVRYQEIAGVDMPPRWLAAGLRIGGR